MSDVRATELQPGDVIGRHDRPGERLLFLGVSPPALMPTGREPREALLYVLSVGYEDGTGFALPLFEDETVIRYPQDS